jgi:hypothetical protein
MPRGGSRNDPLAGWRRENLAGSKRRQGQAQNVQATQYDDGYGGRRSVSPRAPLPPQAGGIPTRGRPPLRMRSEYCDPSPSRGLPTRGRPPSHMRSEYPTPSSSPRPCITYRSQGCGTRPRHRIDGSAMPPCYRNPSPHHRKRVFTEEEKAACPFGDTRWPPKGAYLRPLHLHYEVNGMKRRVYYNLIYQDTAFEATEWLIAMEAKAAEATSNIPDEEAPQITTIMHSIPGR